MRFQVGDIRITQVRESFAAVPVLGMFPQADVALIEANRDWLQPDYMDAAGDLTLSIHALVVESMGKTIVIDTCVGERPVPGYDAMSNRKTTFLADFAGAGFDVNTVDIVMCTHLHFDHVGWNTQLVDGEWVPTFPNARYVLCRDEWAHWSEADGEGYAATLDDAVRPVIDAGLADLVAPDHQVTDEIRLELTPGHTPGHVAVHIESGGEHALITGDLAHHPVQFAEPDWFAAPDTDREQSTATRRRLLDEYADTDVLVIGTHFGPPCAGHLVRDGNGFRFAAVATLDG